MVLKQLDSTGSNFIDRCQCGDVAHRKNIQKAFDEVDDEKDDDGGSAGYLSIVRERRAFIQRDFAERCSGIAGASALKGDRTIHRINGDRMPTSENIVEQHRLAFEGKRPAINCSEVCSAYLQERVMFQYALNQS